MRRQWAALNVTIVEPEERSSEPEGMPVWDTNWPSLIAFLDLATQWRASVGFGACVYFGMDYAGCKAALGKKAWRRLADDLRMMERHALPILNGGEAPVERS